MSHAKKKKASLVRSIYFTMYQLCWHLTYLEGDAGAETASLMVSIVGMFLALALYSWAVLIFGLPSVGRWLVLPVGSIMIINRSLFVKGQRGDKFGDEFIEYSDLKQTLLYIAAAVIMIAILVGSFLSAVAYRHAHGFTM
jgi:hypothetical protein